MRVELVAKGLRAAGHECVVLNTGATRRVPSPDYETVLSPLDFVRKLWRYSRRGFTIHEHVNGDSPKGFVRTLVSELIGLATGKRCYLTFHAGVEQIYFPRSRAPRLVPLYKVMFAIPKAIICNSETVKERIIEYGVSARKIVAIPAFTRQYLEFVPIPLPPLAADFFKRVPEVLFTYIRVRDGFNLETLASGFGELARRRASVGLLVVGVSGDIDDALLSSFCASLAESGVTDRTCLIDDLDHDGFLTAVTRSALCLRTPTTDGVSASVLESLALGTPVVAAENGNRPPGVVTFRADDPTDMARQIEYVLDNRVTISATMARPVIRDTLAHEVAVLAGAGPGPSDAGTPL